MDWRYCWTNSSLVRKRNGNVHAKLAAESNDRIFENKVSRAEFEKEL
jgi:hypothetical protein